MQLHDVAALNTAQGNLSLLGPYTTSTPLLGSSSLKRAIRCSEAQTTIRQSTRREITKPYIFIKTATRNSKSRSAKEFNSYTPKFYFTNDYYSYLSPSIFGVSNDCNFNSCKRLWWVAFVLLNL